MTTTKRSAGMPASPSTPGDNLSPEQVSELLQVPVPTLYAWRYHRTGPPAFRVGKHVRYRRRDLEAWIEAQLAAERTTADPTRTAASG